MQSNEIITLEMETSYNLNNIQNSNMMNKESKCTSFPGSLTLSPESSSTFLKVNYKTINLLRSEIINDFFSSTVSNKW